MFDGIKVLDVSVEVDALLTNDRLTFGGLVDTQTGFILNPIRRAQDRGLNFQLIPRRTGPGYRVEVKGSLHKFFNNGLHNADQYTANDVLLTLSQLVNEYGFNLFESKINNVEFGVNIELPFPISQVFASLICHKNQPFKVDSQSQTPFYVCHWQHYTVKIYDKGKQKGLGGNLLRFEIRVRKMQYFRCKGIPLRTLADLLNVANYRVLGALLVDTFNEILFDDAAINLKGLTPEERSMYERCRNPRHWLTPDDLAPKQAAAHRQRLSRDKDRFRALLNQHGSNWQEEVLMLVRQTWEQLTTVDDDLLTRIEDHKTVWRNLIKPDISDSVAGGKCNEETVRNRGKTCHELTNISPPNCHELTESANTDLSRINPLYSELHCDTGKPDQLPPPDESIGTPERPDESTGTTERPGAVRSDSPTSAVAVCPVSGALIEEPKPGQRFVSATMLRNDDDLLIRLNQRFTYSRKGSQEDEFSRVAHNVRNRESNPRNNLRRKLNRVLYGQDSRQGLLFPVADMLTLSDSERQTLNYWKGTRFELPI